MNLKLYDKNPWRLFYEADKDLENFLGFPAQNKERGFPACDFHEDREHCLIRFDLPGIPKENIKINYENQVLTISGSRKHEGGEHQNHPHILERFYGSFTRSFSLPLSIDEEGIKAHFENGVLELFLPKTAKSRGKEIPVTEGKRPGLFSKLSKGKKESA